MKTPQSAQSIFQVHFLLLLLAIWGHFPVSASGRPVRVFVGVATGCSNDGGSPEHAEFVRKLSAWQDIPADEFVPVTEVASADIVVPGCAGVVARDYDLNEGQYFLTIPGKSSDTSNGSASTKDIFGTYFNPRLTSRISGHKPRSALSTPEVYSSSSGEGGQGQCAVVVPRLGGPLLAEEDLLFEEWRHRPCHLYFEPSGDDRCSRRHMELRERCSGLKGVLGKSYPVCDKSHSKTDAKYCLISRCSVDLLGGGVSDAFYEALSAGCIPVVIADAWSLIYAPFIGSGLLNYRHFMLEIPEGLFLTDTFGLIRLTYTMPAEELRVMHRALLNARRALLWSHPRSDTHVNVLRDAAKMCTLINYRDGSAPPGGFSHL